MSWQSDLVKAMPFVAFKFKLLQSLTQGAATKIDNIVVGKVIIKNIILNQVLPKLQLNVEIGYNLVKHKLF